MTLDRRIRAWVKDWVSAGFAVLANGVTGGDSHDHDGGDGAAVPVGGLATANAPTAGDVLTYDGAAMRWAKTVVYAPTSITKVAGGASAGVVASLAEIGGGVYTVAEIAATPGFNIEVGFTGVVEFNEISMHEWYDGSVTHNVQIGIYNNNTASWDILLTIQDQFTYTSLTFTIANYVPYVLAGVVRVRFYHSSAGNAAHDLYLDQVVLKDTVGGTTGGMADSHTLVFKTADETVNNSDVYQQDDHIRNIPTAANTRYAFYLFIHYSSGATPDLKVRLYHTQADWVANGFYDLDALAGTGATSAGSYIEWLFGAAGADKYCNVSGEFKVNTAGALTLEWAQNTADASDTTLLEGSYLLLTPEQ